ncbi:sugar-binding transcriptional regulator [Aurantimonas sp. Leaf443]|uniref:sugar-binding transcriptional regulator n=1 Tax=Aurantimonas sp. Leaf443 TaxID=1736378 RepID=UPI0006F9C86A|nr:sugar-binding transcriptional regulator [Aurantimonas sp. Leaf443]KQT85364.1 DNA-binding transcriptional regulator [Aurantimonas sp. Leaf443]
MSKPREEEVSRLDEAARAGWLYYVAGNTQEEIAGKLGLSRQSVQRLVSLSMSAGLVRVRIDHPIAACLDLGARLKARFGLAYAEVVPSDPASGSTTLGIAQACADELERRLLSPVPIILAIGTGRTLKAAVEHLPATIRCPQHRIVSLTGNVAPDGSAALYNVIFSMADRVEAPHYPMPLPVVVSSAQERALLHEQKVIRSTLALAAQADTSFVGVGEIGPQTPLLLDRFIGREEEEEIARAGAVGEICGWIFGADGRIIDCAFNERVASAPLPSTARGTVIGVAMGAAKRPALRAALGALLNGVITDETTARSLLED